MTDKLQQDLNKQAVEEILRDVNKGKERCKTMGALGWQRPKISSVNKRFLHQMVASAARSSARESSRRREPDRKDLSATSKSLSKTNHSYYKSSKLRDESSRSRDRHARSSKHCSQPRNKIHEHQIKTSSPVKKKCKRHSET